MGGCPGSRALGDVMIEAGHYSGSSHHIDLPCAKGILQNKIPTKRGLGDCSTRRSLPGLGRLFKIGTDPPWLLQWFLKTHNHGSEILNNPF